MAKPALPKKTPKIEDLEGIEIKVPAKLTTKHGSKRSDDKIQYIVLHYIGVPNLDARSVCERFIRTTAQKSTHFTVDENEIWRVCEDRHIAWHCGTREGKYKSKTIRNANAIGIDLCERLDSGEFKSVYDPELYIPEATVARAVLLCAALCKRYKLQPQQALARHWDVTGKVCPAPFVGSVVSTHTHNTHDRDWEIFVERVKSVLSKDCIATLKQIQDAIGSSSSPTTEQVVPAP